MHFNLLKLMPLYCTALVLGSALSGCDRKQIQAHLQDGSGGGLRADYYTFNNGDAYRFQKKVLSRVDKAIDFPYGSNGPGQGVPNDFFAVRWYGYLIPPKSGKYMLCTCTDDGVKITFNGEQIVNYWISQGARFWGANIDVEAGKRYPIRMDYYDGGSLAHAQLYWAENPSGATWDQVCRNFTPPAAPDQPAPPMEGCAPGQVINPALEIVSPAYLQPGENEADELLDECRVPSRLLSPAEAPDPSHPNTQRARRLFQRLAGVDLSSFDSRIAQMKSLLDQNRPKDAARVVTSDPSFYDKTVRTFAARISTRAERPDAVMNDFIATVVGVTRDQIDARKLLTGNFLYRANPKVMMDESLYGVDALIRSNVHYQSIDESRLPLACVIDRQSSFSLASPPDYMIQKIADPGTSPVTDRVNPDPAGVLTSRAFAEAHMIAGTNRRPVQKALEYFACAPIDSWRDAEISDQYIGRDVERFPNGPTSFNEFLNNCKTCHGPMDAMRGAFAAYHFENNIVKYAPFFIERARFQGITDAMEQERAMKLSSSACENQPTTGTTICGNMGNNNPRLPVHWKLNHNVNYPNGSFVKDSSWTNLLTSSRHMLRFGWSGETSGSGVREFGRMIANSRAFPVCMAKRAYAEVCKDDPFRADFPPELTQWLDQLGEGFAQAGYNLKDLFETVGINCSQ